MGELGFLHDVVCRVVCGSRVVADARNPHRSSPEIFEFNLELAAARRSTS